MKKLLWALLASILLVAEGVEAGPISTGSWVVFDFGGVGSPASGNDFTFTLSSPEDLKVTDVLMKGDAFTVYDGASLLFTTPSVPIDQLGNTFDPNLAFGDPTYSHGSFLLGAGSHSIDIFAAASPSGGGGAYMGVFAPVPEPETYTMLLAGLGLIGFIAYRRKSDSSIMLGTA